MSNFSNNKPINRLLAALSSETYQSLVPYLQSVELPQHKILYHAGEKYNYAYFPTYAVISTVAIMENGSTTEIGIIGNEGMVGLPIILNTTYTNSTAIVQVGGVGVRIAANYLQAEMERNRELKQALMSYVQARIIQLGQTAACNRYHTIEQRFARWMLMVRDSIEKDQFKLTQEFISQMLGVRRAGVTTVASKFQEQGIIHYARGSITINDPERLETAACECYQLINNEFDRLLRKPYS